MSFLRTYDELLEKQNKIWDKVSNDSIRKDFIVNQCKLKQNLIKEKLAQIFMMMEYQKKVFIAFVYKIGKNDYPEVLSKECKFIVKEKRRIRYITADQEIYSDDSDKEDSDIEN